MAVEALSNTADLEDAREKLIQCITGLEDGALDDPNVVGVWNIREALAHILAWDQWGEEALPALERGESPAKPRADELSQTALAQHRNASVAELQRLLRTARLAIISRLAAMSDEERSEPRFELEGQRISANDFVDGFIDHDHEHSCHIRAWRKSKGL
jgi:uncharacterized damage-inducible protein DinB